MFISESIDKEIHTHSQLNESVPILILKPISQASGTLANSRVRSISLVITLCFPLAFIPFSLPSLFLFPENANLPCISGRTPTGDKWDTQIRRFNKVTIYKSVETTRDSAYPGANDRELL